MIENDIDQFIDGLKIADPDELGFILALTAHCRSFLNREYGWNLDEPAAVFGTTPNAIETLERLIRELRARKSGQMELLAAGMAVWLHTLRAARHPELRGKGQEIWKELLRGQSFVSYKAKSLQRQFGYRLNIENAGSVPTLTDPPKTPPAVKPKRRPTRRRARQV